MQWKLPKSYERIFCKDGFNMSVQANRTAYSSPREDDAKEYTHVEVGFPSKPEPLLMEWVETDGDPTDNVYCWVPVGVIRAVLEKHGGMVGGELPPGILPFE